MINRKALPTQYVKMLILDEADEMLSFGFKDQIYNIFTQLPRLFKSAYCRQTSQ